ncbi:MAG: damage-inducible protein DinB [Acidobacteria bacterium]|nr:MAG: damage-inducible protein DinB [Acidobacteriota bacterium]
MKKWNLAAWFLVFAALSFATEQASPPTSGFRAEFLSQLSEVQDKLVSLAQAEPAEKYTWRPADGVRSISEVYMHVAGSNYLLLQFVGVQPPPGISRDMEKITDKAKVIDALKQSFDFVRQSVIKIPDSDLDRKVKFFSGETTVRDVLFSLANHMHEHLGQSIAYARENGVVPPWTAEEQKQSTK